MTYKIIYLVFILKILLLEGQALYRIPLQRQQTIKYDSNFFKNAVENVQYKTGSESIQNYKDMQYFGDVTIGKSKQHFTCIWDTGSAWLWVPGTDCTNCGYAKDLYNCKSQSANCDKSKKLRLQYGMGGAMAYVNKDRVSFDQNLTVNEQIFLVIYQQSSFDKLKADGICGLGFETLSYMQPTFIDNLKTQGVIKEKKFSWYLDFSSKEGSKSLSELIIGGYDKKYMTEDFTYANVTDEHYWAVDVEDVYSNFQGLNVNAGYTKKVKALIDSGTSLIYLDQITFDKFFMSLILSGNECGKDMKLGFYYCNQYGQNGFAKLPSFGVRINNKYMDIPAKDFVVGYKGKLYMLILPMNMRVGYRLCILGDLFMRRYYTIFNEDDMTIGFAKAKIQQTKLDSAKTLKIKKSQAPPPNNRSYVVPLLIFAGIIIALILIKIIKRNKEEVDYELKESLVTNINELQVSQENA